MIDSGAATRVSPPWFAQDSPLYTLQQGQGPSLRTATDEEINIYGYKWVLMSNSNNYKIVVPFYVCDVKQPLMSATRLTEQGFDIQFKDTPTMSHSRGFHSNLVRRAELFYLPVKLSTSQATWSLTFARLKQQNQYLSHQWRLHQQEWKFSDTGMTLRHSTHKDSWSEHIGQHAKQSSCQTAGVQYQPTDLRTTEGPLSTDRMATTRPQQITTEKSHGSEWREEQLFQATSHHSHQQDHHKHSKHLKQHLHQHHQLNSRWPGIHTRGQLRVHHNNISKHPHQQLRFHIQKMFDQHQGNIWKRVRVQPRRDLYMPQ